MIKESEWGLLYENKIIVVLNYKNILERGKMSPPNIYDEDNKDKENYELWQRIIKKIRELDNPYDI